tara:strand:+ start:4028 stop:4336 length:309 start_codon:yes stop_codon:yes gene_type:complete
MSTLLIQLDKLQKSKKLADFDIKITNFITQIQYDYSDLAAIYFKNVLQSLGLGNFDTLNALSVLDGEDSLLRKHARWLLREGSWASVISPFYEVDKIQCLNN